MPHFTSIGLPPDPSSFVSLLYEGCRFIASYLKLHQVCTSEEGDYYIYNVTWITVSDGCLGKSEGWCWHLQMTCCLPFVFHIILQTNDEILMWSQLFQQKWQDWLKRCLPGLTGQTTVDFATLVPWAWNIYKNIWCSEKYIVRSFWVVLTLYCTLSHRGSCGLGSDGTDRGGSSDVLRWPAEPSEPRTTSASLTVAVELQTEAVSSTSPPTAEWKLWLELLKPLTLSPDDSELSTATNPRRTINAWVLVKHYFIFRVLVQTHVISC